jgi:DNA-binding response OmpR family regulator/anti-sigma regulatory factor (Ser/Thr protein kinase)
MNLDCARVLVVDDEPMNLVIIGEFLAETQFEVDAVESGEAAWQALNGDRSFDLVLLDRMMPGIDGMEVLRRIKADSRLSDLPVIMQTAAATPNQVREGLQAGAHYYLTKPFEQGALLAIMRSALEGRRNARSLRTRLETEQNVTPLIRRGGYELRTLDEAQCLASYLARLCPQPETAAMGLTELIVNAVEHGNLGVSYQEKAALKLADRWAEEIARRLALPENRDKRVTVDFVRDDKQIAFTVRDQGCGFDWQRYLDFDPDRAFDPNGRGIALARSLAFASLSYGGNGSQVTAVVALPAAGKSIE